MCIERRRPADPPLLGTEDSDVLGGWVLGLAWLAGATAVFEVWREERGSRPAHPLAEGVEPEAGRDLDPSAGRVD